MAKVNLPDERLGDSYLFLQPSRPCMITTFNPNGTLNVAPFGWNMPVSVTPARVAVALVNQPKNHTLQNIEREGEYVLNKPVMAIAERLVQCSYFHPEGVSKFEQAGFTPQPSQVIRTPGVAECRAQLECRVHQFVNCGDHTLVIGDVVAATYEDRDFSQNLTLKVDEAWPVIHHGQYKQEQGQVHLFVVPAGYRAVEVNYPKLAPADLARARARTKQD